MICFVAQIHVILFIPSGPEVVALIWETVGVIDGSYRNCGPVAA